MAERSKGKSLRRVHLARRFVELGRLRSGLPTGITLKHAVIGFGIALLTTALLIEYEFQHIPDFSVGDIADRTIEAPRDFTAIDEQATREKRELALQNVPAVFTWDFRVTHRVASEIRMAFADARQLIAEEKERLELPEDRPLSEQARRELKSRIEDMLPRLSHGRVLDICLRHGFAQEFEDQLVQLLTHSMKAPGVLLNRATLLRFRDRGIALHNAVTGEMEELSDWLAIRDLAQARELLHQQEHELTFASSEDKRELIDFLEQWVVPNTYFDEEATQRLEHRALAQVDPVLVQVKQGKTIVRAGDEIAEHHLSQLSALGELQLTDRWFDRFLGVFIIALFLFFVLWSFFQLDLLKKTSRNDFVLLALVLLGGLLVGRLFIALADTVAFSLRVPGLQDPLHFYFFAPLALGSVLTMLLLGVNQTILFALLNAVFVALLTGQLSIVVFSLAGSLMTIYTLRQYRERSTLIRAGLWIGGVNLLVALAFQISFTPQTFSWLAFLVRSAGAMVSGLLSVMLATLVLPSLESIFRLTTDIRLLELSNLNSPILRRLALEAPGTYHHSITVGTLAETGAEAIGANTLLIRVGAYYHDIGKLKHPEYYVENQIFSANKHENLSPTMSSLILASHVKDGLAIADETNLGPKVAALIPQHHGTRVMTYFYQKAREAAAEKGAEVSEDDFRYPGPKPQSKEAAILMLADQVEAASRTLQEPTPGQIRGLINRVTQATIQDGQFDECEITMKEVTQVARAFERVLTGMYHHRIEYPGFDFNKRRVEQRPLESVRLQ